MKGHFAFQRLAGLVLMVILLFSLASCNSQSGTPDTYTPLALRTKTIIVTETVGPTQTPPPENTLANSTSTITSIPTLARTSTKTIAPTRTTAPTRTPAPTKTLRPTNTPSPTGVPGPELTTYLPAAADLPQCRSLLYTIQLSSASITCTLKTWGTVSISFTVAGSPYKTTSLKVADPYRQIDFPTFGDGSIAGKTAIGDKVIATFIKNKTRISIIYSAPKSLVNIEDVVQIAQIMSDKDPGDVNPPLGLEFSGTQNPDLVRQSFSQVNFWVRSNGFYRQTPDFPINSIVCLVVVPTKTTRDNWSAYLYDQQKNMVVSKVTGEMVEQKVCSGLAPVYAKDQFKAGDQYEIRLVVGQDWVATFELVTK
jgi:hypothetical protein